MIKLHTAFAVVVLCVALSACLYQAPVNLISCTGAPPLQLKKDTINKMNRDELTRYLRYKAWWKQNCKQSESLQTFTNPLSSIR